MCPGLTLYMQAAKTICPQVASTCPWAVTCVSTLFGLQSYVFLGAPTVRSTSYRWVRYRTLTAPPQRRTRAARRGRVDPTSVAPRFVVDQVRTARRVMQAGRVPIQPQAHNLPRISVYYMNKGTRLCCRLMFHGLYTVKCL